MPRQIASLLLQPEATLEASQALKIPLQTLAGSSPPHTHLRQSFLLRENGESWSGLPGKDF